MSLESYLEKRKNAGATPVAAFASGAKTKVEKKTKEDYADDRFWTLKTDPKTGAGTAVIRFLPGEGFGSGLPYISWLSHYFKNPKTGRSFVAPCNTTPGSPYFNAADKYAQCPFCVENHELWESGEEGKALVRGVDGKNARKPRANYVSNILVLKDKACPENEGKVFLFKYTAAIFNMLVQAEAGDADTDTVGIHPEDLLEGANFKFSVRQVNNMNDFKMSKFEDPSPLYAGDAEKLKKVWEARYDLAEYFLSDKIGWKTPDDIRGYMNWVNGLRRDGSAAAAPVEQVAEQVAVQHEAGEKREAERKVNVAAAKEVIAPKASTVPAVAFEDDGDDAWIAAAARGEVK